MPGLLSTRACHIALIVGTSLILTLPSLGTTSLWDIDEGLNAEAAREMLESGDWVVPYFNFKQRTAKPAMLYWFQAASYRAFGINEFAARLPSALATMLTALLVYRLGRRMFSPEAGLLAALVLLTSIQVGLLSHAATPDAILLFCFVLTMTLFWDGYSSGGRTWLWLPAVGCGLAMLAKGPVGLALPIAVIGYFLIAQRQLARLLDVRLLLGFGLVILVAGPWYALVGVETHGAFLRAFWRNENVGRFMSSMEGHRGPAWYYIATMIVGFAPWCAFLVPTTWSAFSALTTPTTAERRDRMAVRFLLCWVAVYVGFFSLAQTKLPNYVYPAFPPLALLTARFLERWRSGLAAPPHWQVPVSLGSLALVGMVTAAIILVAGGAVLPGATRGRAIAGLAPWALLGVVPVAGALVAAWFTARRNRELALSAVGVMAVVFLSGIAQGPLLFVEGQKAPRALVEQSGACRPTDDVRIGSLLYFQPSLVFYCQREVREFTSERDAIDLLRGPLPAYLFCPAQVGDILVAALPHVRQVARQRDLYRGFDVVVLANDSLESPRDRQVASQQP